MVSSASELQWYAIRVRPKQEGLVAQHLNDLNVENYLPVRAGTTSSKRQFALFPGYLFVRLDLQRGPRLYNVPGVVRIMGWNGKPSPIDDKEITTVKQILKSSLPIRTSSTIKCGTAVLVCGGPLAGMRGLYLRNAGNDTLVVSLPLLQRSLAVTLPTDWISVFGNELEGLCA